MDRNREDGIETQGHPESTRRELNLQPGPLDKIENATAYANRTDQDDVAGQMPRGGPDGERLHGREGLTAREGMAGGTDAIREGEDLGSGVHAKPADGLEGADGRIHRGEDVGHGIEAKPADGLEGADGRIDRGEDIGNGIRARPAGEQDPGNPLV